NEDAIDHHLRDRFTIQVCLGQHVFHLLRLQYAVLNKKLGDLLVIHEAVESLNRSHQLTSPIVLEITSSAEVRPARTLRTPSSRSVRIPSSRPRCRNIKVELRLLIIWRTSSSISKISNMPMRPL